MPHKRGPWSTGEDATLLSLVQHHGPQNWVRISQLLGSRSPKQCRERYHQNLKPTLNHSPISPQEGELIEDLVQQIGRRWADISRRLPGRSDNAVKNWWNGGVNRRRRITVRRNDFSKPGDVLKPSAQTFAKTQATAMAGQRVLSASRSKGISHTPLLSPVRSEVSMPDSIGETPSLVSDQGSQHTLPSPTESGSCLHSVPVSSNAAPGLWTRGPITATSLPPQRIGPQRSLISSMASTQVKPPEQIQSPLRTDSSLIRPSDHHPAFILGSSQERSLQKSLESQSFAWNHSAKVMCAQKPYDSSETHCKSFAAAGGLPQQMPSTVQGDGNGGRVKSGEGPSVFHSGSMPVATGRTAFSGFQPGPRGLAQRYPFQPDCQKDVSSPRDPFKHVPLEAPAVRTEDRISKGMKHDSCGVIDEQRNKMTLSSILL